MSLERLAVRGRQLVVEQRRQRRREALVVVPVIEPSAAIVPLTLVAAKAAARGRSLSSLEPAIADWLKENVPVSPTSRLKLLIGDCEPGR